MFRVAYQLNRKQKKLGKISPLHLFFVFETRYFAKEAKQLPSHNLNAEILKPREVGLDYLKHPGAKMRDALKFSVFSPYEPGAI